MVCFLVPFLFFGMWGFPSLSCELSFSLERIFVIFSPELSDIFVVGGGARGFKFSEFAVLPGKNCLHFSFSVSSLPPCSEYSVSVLQVPP